MLISSYFSEFAEIVRLILSYVSSRFHDKC